MRKRFFRAATIAIAAGLFIAFLFAVPLMEQVYIDEAELRLQAALTLMAENARSDGGPQSLTERTAAALAQAGQHIRLTVISEDGQVLGDSESSPAGMGSHENRKEVVKALSEGRGRDIRRSATLGGRQLYAALRGVGAGGETVIYRAALPLDGMNRVLYLLWGCGAIGIFMGLVAALIAASYSAGRVVEPLHSLTRAARSMADGDEPAALSLSEQEAPDELGELSRAFSRMAERLAAAQLDLAQNNDRLAGVLQGMDDGVIAVDAAGSVTLMTDRARALLGDCPATAAHLSERGVNYAAIAALLETVADTGEPVRDTLFLAAPEERTLQVDAAPLSSVISHTGAEEDGGALAVISDITRLTKLEEIRSEFVANVTHELKTPLTSIRGYIELLKSGPRDEDTTHSFYEIIEIEAERLQKLTDDLLQLSEIENRRSETEDPLTSLSEIIERAAGTLRPEAESRGIRLYLFTDPSLMVKANPRRLYQLIKNLMENAVKYNRDGGAVNVSAHGERGLAVIRVHDTGIGIPAEHRERVFERFYRVDKGRSRELGGTGLGLSIVKHIVSLYGGDLRVDSEPGVGTTFTVRLKIQ